jgi:hypothetical protein
MPGARCTRSLGDQEKQCPPVVTVTTSTPESPSIPRAMVYGLLRALPGEPGFLATVALGIASIGLDTSVGVSGPHDLTVRLRCARRLHPPRPSHPVPRP